MAMPVIVTDSILQEVQLRAMTNLVVRVGDEAAKSGEEAARKQNELRPLVGT